MGAGLGIDGVTAGKGAAAGLAAGQGCELQVRVRGRAPPPIAPIAKGGVGQVWCRGRGCDCDGVGPCGHGYPLAAVLAAVPHAAQRVRALICMAAAELRLVGLWLAARRGWAAAHQQEAGGPVVILIRAPAVLPAQRGCLLGGRPRGGGIEEAGPICSSTQEGMCGWVSCRATGLAHPYAAA
eukprot:1159763-Pelagomonas_calceolata.AAC.4